MVGLALAVISPILLPLAYDYYIEPISFTTRFIAALIIAVGGAIVLYFTYRSSAQNEP